MASAQGGLNRKNLCKHRHSKCKSICEEYLKQGEQSEGTNEDDFSVGKYWNPNFDLHKDVKICRKNPNHHHFIPVGNVSMASLPTGFQDRLIYDTVHLLIKIAVILRMHYTSEGRSDHCTLQGKNAPEHSRWGSGSAFVPCEIYQGDKCPSKACRNSPTPCKKWYCLWVSTAHHVVFDDEEAAMTEVGFYYDDPSCKNIVFLEGVRLVNFDKESDRCILECVTHDENIYLDVLTTRRLLRENELQLIEKYAVEIAAHGGPPLSIIVSHPHHCSKQVSIGTDVRKTHLASNGQDVEWTKYLYDTPTCQGSSGALVWFLGQKRVGYCDNQITTHTHTGTCGNNLPNKSGGGLDYVTADTSNKSLLFQSLNDYTTADDCPLNDHATADYCPLNDHDAVHTLHMKVILLMSTCLTLFILMCYYDFFNNTFSDCSDLFFESLFSYRNTHTPHKH